MSHTYSHILAAFAREIWAIDEVKFHAIRQVLKLRASGGRVPDEEIAAVVKAAERPVSRSPGSIAILPLFGAITHRANMFSEASGGTSTQGFGKALAQVVSDPNVTAVIIEADTPGGGVSGLPELADQIYKARGSKPIIGVSNTRALSAGYWLLSQCDEIVMAPVSEVGSIGVFLWHENWAENYKMEGIQPDIIRYGEHKAEANDWEPLTDEARAYLQSQVNEVGEMFTRAVARGRGVSPDRVRNEYGQGRSVMAKDAVRLGMADRVATMDDTILRVASGRWKAPDRRAAESIYVRMVAMEKIEFPIGSTGAVTVGAITGAIKDEGAVVTDFDQQAAAIAEAAQAGDTRPSEPPTEVPVPEPDIPPEVPPEAVAEAAVEDDGYDELARYRLEEWEQSDAETRTEAEVR
jgi:capsid assembly protease